MFNGESCRGGPLAGPSGALGPKCALQTLGPQRRIKQVHSAYHSATKSSTNTHLYFWKERCSHVNVNTQHLH